MPENGQKVYHFIIKAVNLLPSTLDRTREKTNSRVSDTVIENILNSNYRDTQHDHSSILYMVFFSNAIRPLEGNFGIFYIIF